MKNMRKKLFYQDWGTFYGTMLVACGYKDYAEIKKQLKKEKSFQWLEAMENKSEEFDTAHFSKWKHKDVTYQLLFLEEWKQNEVNYAILAHELLHAIQFCMPDFLDVTEEYEACAYQHTYLFRSIARQLNKK